MSRIFLKQMISKTQRWQLFYATDFHSVMYPCFTLCRILGIFPYKINKLKFEISKPLYILSIIITCALCLCEYTILCQYNTFINVTKFEATSFFFEIIFYCVSAASIAIVTLVLSRSRMRLLQIIMEISLKLDLESYQKLSRLIHAKDIFGFFYLICKFFTCTYITNLPFLQTIVSLYTVLLVFAMDMLYINCVCILKACYKEINNSLLHMQDFMINKEPRVAMLFYKQRNTFLIIKLKNVQKQHLMISKTVQMLNIIFSLQLHATIISSYSAIIFGFYHYFHVVKWYNGIINLNEMFSIMFLLTAIDIIIKLALLVWACETGKNQAQEIRTTIHDVLNSSRDEQIKIELQLFSLQLLHGENRFSAKGFNVDATFFASMVGTITTYALILLQFLKMSQSCDETYTINTT
ncbi:PREDICTED: putative gustatory receptor 23a, isoform B [Vollenhovia emeryi]|uniref:putative gustatory receptor 23a, isoform B n=1 Tax=Vollenhovia emeryi TaxID=411798 RepID=UPI0005F47764|nr:PREDICTED: putative gustatory receptor 23a, isoform B [Vollenhovia emeryi]